MIQNKQVVEIQTGKSKKSAQFGMEFNPKAFSILSDSLYQYKERAVGREYCTNAFDSHQDEGYPERPFRVHVPTELEPYFEVQDYGIGLDEDGVMQTFATFFHSTKDNDNSVNGCLGLGSKSFLAVSDQCTVTSIKDSIKNTFICHKDRQGIPTVALKNTQKVSEENGVTVRIPVDGNNLDTWKTELLRIIACFDVEPLHNITDEHSLGLLKGYQQDREDIRKSDYGFIDLKRKSGCKVLMGNVLYPIENPLDFVRGKKLNNFAAGVINQVGIRVKAELGELNIAPSRESLSLDMWTRKALEYKITKLVIEKYRELAGEVGNEVSSYYNFYHKFNNTPLWTIFQNMKFPFTKGMSLSHYENPESLYRRTKNYMYPFASMSWLRGYVPTINSNTPSTLSYTFTTMNHERIRNWKSIYIAQGTTVRLRDTLKNVVEKLGKVGCVLHADTPERAKWLQEYFNVSDNNMIQCEDFFVEKVRKAPARKRKGVGKLEDTTVLAKNFTLGVKESSFSEVDLTKGNIAYIEGDSFNIAFEGTMSYSWTSSRVKEIMKWCGVDTLVVANMNNLGKIKKSEVPLLKQLWKDKAKPVKNILLKQTAWEERLQLKESTALLSGKLRTYKKLERLATKVKTVPEQFPNINIHTLGWAESKVYKKEMEKVNTLNTAVRSEIKAVKEKLPLWSKVCNDVEQTKYYLKLEKIIK